MKPLTDSFHRVHDYLRISLTDKCNLNCVYCNPVINKTPKLKRDELLSYSELLRAIEIFVGKLGVKKIRFTGGEPLLRKNVIEFFKSVYSLKKKYGFEIGLTTNGTLLADKIEYLKNYGLDKLNISLDTLHHDRFIDITGNNGHSKVLDGIEKSISLGFQPLKINVVVMKNFNDDEILDFVEFVKDKNINVRFIEFMPFGNNDWNKSSFIGYEEIKSIIESKYELIPFLGSKNLVAKDYLLKGFPGRVSFISSISNHFCQSCNRLRIDSKGKMKLCLFSGTDNDLDLKNLFSLHPNNDDKIIDNIFESLYRKPLEHPPVDELLKLEENNMLSIGG